MKIVLIVAGGLICSVATYLMLRRDFRLTVGVWRKKDRRMVLAVALTTGPIGTLAAITMAISTWIKSHDFNGDEPASW